jgi:hypothetical protein
MVRLAPRLPSPTPSLTGAPGPSAAASSPEPARLGWPESPPPSAERPAVPHARTSGVAWLARAVGLAAAGAVLGAGLMGAAVEAPNPRLGAPLASSSVEQLGPELPPLPPAEHFLPAGPDAVRSLRPIEALDGGWVDGPGQRPQLNANDPEILTTVRGGRTIAVSTLAPDGTASPAAHLDHAFDGPFRVFAHQQNRTGAPVQQLVLVYNPGETPVRLEAEALVSTTTGEAPYTDLGGPGAIVGLDPEGRRVSGPGDRTAFRALVGEVEGARTRIVAPRSAALLLTTTVPDRQEVTTQAELRSDGPVRLAVLYTPDRPDAATALARLRRGGLLAKSSHDRTPTPPGASGAFIYGRVAGVVPRSTYLGRLTNDDARARFLVEAPGVQRYALNPKTTQGLGTGRDDAAPLDARYPGSAFASHGNYGAELRVGSTLFNPSSEVRRVRVFLDNPSQPGRLSRALRQSLELRIERDGQATVRRLHASLRPGVESSTPIAELTLQPGEEAELALRMFYSANNTPPQVLRVEVQP